MTEQVLPRMNEMEAALTAVVREADATFQRVGGSSRHWVRDCFLPALAAHQLTISAPSFTTICRHCGDDIRPRDWMDRETHSTCADGPNRNKAHSPSLDPPALGDGDPVKTK